MFCLKMGLVVSDFASPRGITSDGVVFGCDPLAADSQIDFFVIVSLILQVKGIYEAINR